ncbi:MAG: cytochrome c [Spirochaetales bacterium]|nr:cytochrome c [Leptospiraceae bacterium]MCP5483720.1 cytochrome c [Spirochaetales bacterium]
MKSIFYSLLSVTAVLFLAFGTYCGQRPEEESAEPESIAGGMSAEAQHGQELFVANGCQTCHGERGHGDGPAGQALQPPPRNFQSVADYKQGSTVDDITNTLLTGVPGTPMAAYAHLSEADRRAIAQYVVYLQTNG